MTHHGNRNAVDIRQAELAFRQGRLADAERMARLHLQQQPDSWQALHLVGLVCAAQARFQEAVQSLDRAIRVDGRRMESWNALAQLLMRAGRLEDADRVCRGAIAANPRAAEVFSNHALVLEGLGRLEEALEQVTAATRLQPGMAVAHFNRARILENLGQHDQAEAACRRTLKLAPDHVEAHNLAGVIARSQGRLRESGSAFRKALHLRPDYAPALNNLAVNSLEQGEPEQAATYARSAITGSPGYPEAHYNLGLALERQDRLQESIASFRRVLQLNPQHVAAGYSCGHALKAAGELEQARACCEQAVRVDPACPEARVNLGSVLSALGDKEQALAEYTRATELRPGLAEAHCSRGGLLMELGRFDEARPALETALRQDPGLSMANYLMAALGGQATPDRMADDGVRQLFDDYAPTFETHLVEELEYCAHRQLVETVLGVGLPEGKLDILDLGCGTGLCGAALADRAARLVGIDLAPRMLELAERRNIYTRLVLNEVTRAVTELEESFDLVVATDVFIYIGRLEPLFAAVAGCLKPRGLFAFSIETLDSPGDFVLRGTGRYAQSFEYIQRLAGEHGMEIAGRDDFIIRLQRGVPVPGQLVVLRAAH